MQTCTRVINDNLIRHDSEVFEQVRCISVVIDISAIDL